MAKQFQFSLQKVLNIREKIEESRTISLKNSRDILEKERKELKNLETKKNNLLDNHNNTTSSNTSFSLTDFKISTDYALQLTKYIYDQWERVDEANKIVEKNRESLIEAVKNRKVMETLKEKKRAEFLKDYNKKLLKDESEVAIRIARKNNIVKGL